MHHSDLPKHICHKLRAHFEISFPGRTMYDEEGIVSSLSHPLRGEIALHRFQRVLESLRVLHDGRLSRAIASVLERIVFVHDDIIIYEGDRGHGMYFISGGGAKVYVSKAENAGDKREMGVGFDTGSAPRRLKKMNTTAAMEFRLTENRRGSALDANSRVIAMLGPQAFFGEMALLNPDGVSVASVRAKGYCETYCLSIEAYDKLLHEHPTFKSYANLTQTAGTRLTHSLPRYTGSPLYLRFICFSLWHHVLPHGAWWWWCRYIEIVARMRLDTLIASDGEGTDDNSRKTKTAKDIKGALNTDDLTLGELFQASNPAARAMLREGIKEIEEEKRLKSGEPKKKKSMMRAAGAKKSMLSKFMHSDSDAATTV